MALNRDFTAPVVMARGGWKTERMMRCYYAAVTDAPLRAAAEAVSGAEEHRVSARLWNPRGRIPSGGGTWR